MSGGKQLGDFFARQERTVPSEFRIDASCFADEATERLVVLVTREILHTATLIGIDLARLDGVTFASDCEKAGTEVQYIPAGKVALTPIDVPEMLELGRTVPVERAGEIQFHIFFRKGLGVLALTSEKEGQEVVHLSVAHEAAHVDHEGHLQKTFPQLYATEPLACGDRALPTFLRAIDVWSEYAACRSSALFHPSASVEFEDVFCRILSSTAIHCKERIAEYRHEGNALQVFHDVQQISGELFVGAGYLLGHLDGVESKFESCVRARELLEKQPAVGSLMRRLQSELRQMWLSEYDWTSIEVFAPIYELIREMIALNGLVFSRCGDEWRIVMCEDENIGGALRDSLASWTKIDA